jgi:hypothetical protein
LCCVVLCCVVLSVSRFCDIVVTPGPALTTPRSRLSHAIFTSTRTQNSFGGFRPLFMQFIRRNKQLCSWLRSSCLVSELHEIPSLGLELSTLFRNSYLFSISSWYQGISFPSLVKIGTPVLALYANIRTHTNFQFYI